MAAVVLELAQALEELLYPGFERSKYLGWPSALFVCIIAIVVPIPPATSRLPATPPLSTTATPVPASIHRPDPSSTASSSLFGSEAGLSHKADRTSDGQDPVVEDSGRNLRDFIDEQGTEQLMDALDDEQAQIDVSTILPAQIHASGDPAC